MPEPGTMHRLAREPLLHFLLIGAGIIALGRLNPRPAPEPPAKRQQILVTDAVRAQLAADWKTQRSKEPSSDEMTALIDDYVRRETLYREALSMGLDRDDPVVKGRLVQLMDFLAASSAPAVEPTDDDLEALRRAEPDRFAVPGTVSFEHVFFNAERRGVDAARAEADRALAALRSASPPDPAGLGDPFLLPKRFDALRADQAARTFGDAFAGALASAAHDQWIGPVQSVYGLHVVRVTADTPPGLPPLDQIRDRLRTEWLARRERAAAQAFEADLRAKYDVVIEPASAPPSPGPASPKAESGKP